MRCAPSSDSTCHRENDRTPISPLYHTGMRPTASSPHAAPSTLTTEPGGSTGAVVRLAHPLQVPLARTAGTRQWYRPAERREFILGPARWHFAEHDAEGACGRAPMRPSRTSPPRPDPTQSAPAGATWSSTPRPTASCPATPTARRTSSSAASTGARCSGTVPLIRRGATGAGVGRLVGPSWPHEPPAFFAPVPPQGAARRDRVLRTAGCNRPRTLRCRRRGRASSPARASPRGCPARRLRPR